MSDKGSSAESAGNRPNESDEKEEVNAHGAADNGDDEKKEDNDPTFEDLESSAFFKKYAEILFDITLTVYDSGQKSFVKDDFDFYSKFYNPFMDNKPYKRKSVNSDVVRNSLAKIYSYKKCLTYPSIFEPKSSYYDNDKAVIAGLLSFSLQPPPGAGRGWFRIMSEKAIAEANSDLLLDGNIFFRVSTKRTYGAYKAQKTKCRIAVCQTLKPAEFWDDVHQLSNLFDVLLSLDFVEALKIRSVPDIGSGDALLIYCTVSPAEAWGRLKKGINEVYPETMRRDYVMPFATPLDMGVNANIPIRYKKDDKVILSSFTGGIAELSRQAFNNLIINGKIEKTNFVNKKPIRKINREKNVRDFQASLAAIFRENALFIDKNGALHQPAPPEIK